MGWVPTCSKQPVRSPRGVLTTTRTPARLCCWSAYLSASMRLAACCCARPTHGCGEESANELPQPAAPAGAALAPDRVPAQSTADPGWISSQPDRDLRYRSATDRA